MPGGFCTSAFLFKEPTWPPSSLHPRIYKGGERGLDVARLKESLQSLLIVPFEA